MKRFVIFCRVALITNIILILLHLLLRNWLFYFSPITNYDNIQAAIENVNKQEIIHMSGKPVIGHARSFQLSDDFSKEDIFDYRVKYILINKEVLFWKYKR